VARYPGSTHDSFVWRHCYVRRLVQAQYEAGNQCWIFGNCLILLYSLITVFKLLNHFISIQGDFGYPLEPWFLTPFAEAQPGTPEDHFNQRHSSSRHAVECCIGVLKKRFRCLLRYRTLEYAPEKAA